MRSAVAVFAVLCALGIAATLTVGAERETSLAFIIGLPQAGTVMVLPPGHTACQSPIDVPDGGGFDALTVPLGTLHRKGPRIVATVREAPGGAVLARGVLPAGYPDIGTQPRARIALTAAVSGGRRVSVCLRNAGPRSVAIHGSPDAVAPATTLLKDGKPAGVDAAMSFEHPPRSQLSSFAAGARHAALFKAGWVGAWTFWLLAALVALGVPALLGWALLRAGEAGRRP